MSEQAYNSLIVPNLGPENVISSKLNWFLEFLAPFGNQKLHKKIQ